MAAFRRKAHAVYLELHAAGKTPATPATGAWPVILALKRDGQYMSVRNKGPLWVVYPRHAFPELQQAKHNPKGIWQLKEIMIR